MYIVGLCRIDQRSLCEQIHKVGSLVVCIGTRRLTNLNYVGEAVDLRLACNIADVALVLLHVYNVQTDRASLHVHVATAFVYVNTCSTCVLHTKRLLIYKCIPYMYAIYCARSVKHLCRPDIILCALSNLQM